jgi:adenylate cyclase
MRGEAPAEAFRGKIVLIGMTSQLQQDVFSTPFAHARTMPGVEIHANAIDTLVAGDAIREAPEWLNAGLAAAAAILGAALVVRLRAVRAFIVVAAVWTALIVGGVALFSLSGVWIGGMGTTLCLILGYGATTIEHFIREQREKRQLSQFFSPAVLAHVVRRRGSLGSQRRLVTVLFSDVRDFTTMAEKLSAEQIAEILEEYLTAMTAIVFRHGGTVDKYIGDCVMALYNAPFDDPDHAAHAVRTALEVQERTREVSRKWEGKLGFPIRTGVGINTGEAVVGSLGSRQRREYTAIGDTINLGARLETITKDYRAGIIMSETTQRLVAGRFLSRELGTVTVKGKTQPVKIYAVVEHEARKHPRTPVDVPATLIRSADGSERMVRVVNIGDGGIGIAGLPEEWATGTTVSVHCDGGELEKPIRADGTIVWRRDDRGGISVNG